MTQYPIQWLPCVLSENDVVVTAATGSGKTHGYLLPLIDKLSKTPDNSGSLKQFELEDYKDLQTNFIKEEEEEEEEEEDEESDANVKNLTVETEVEVTKRKGWRRVKEVYERSKQYFFVAATLPLNGKRTAGGVLKRMFLDARWITGNYLHRHDPRLEQKWKEVTVDTLVDALIDAMNQGFNFKILNSGSGLSRTMVFANTVAAVEAVA